MMTAIKKLIEPKYWLALSTAVSGMALAGAYYSQYVLEMLPCQLCYWQRKPHWAVVVFGVVALLAAIKKPGLARPALGIVFLLFAAGAGIAGFHAGVEYEWWEGLASCSAQPDPSLFANPIEYFEAISKIVPCDRPAFVLFGISMAGYNFLLSLVMSLVTAFVLFCCKSK